MSIEFANTIRNLRTALHSVTRHTPARSTSPRRLMRRLRTSRAKAKESDSSSSESAHTRVASMQDDARSSHSKVEIDYYHGELTAVQDAVEQTHAEIYLVQTKPATEQTEDILLRAELADAREKLRARELDVERLKLQLEQKTSEAAKVSRKLTTTNYALAELALKNERLETKVEAAATWHIEVHELLGKSRRQASKLAYSNKMLTDNNNTLTDINKELAKQLIIEERKVEVLRFDLVNLDRELENTDCKLEDTEQKLEEAKQNQDIAEEFWGETEMLRQEAEQKFNESDQKREAAEKHAQAIELQTVELMDLAKQDFDELYDELEHIKYIVNSTCPAEVARQLLGQPVGNLDVVNESDAGGQYFYDDRFVQPIDAIDTDVQYFDDGLCVHSDSAIDAIYTVDYDSDNQQQQLSAPGVICLRKHRRTI
ncbi:hypothetical protein LPJ66_011205 [Kickxella alabastrina]|uniref:Uncharacterized protein n=1 Tax=Kickxella alabastrina TaxID=61397 RepID=A0ACC1I2G5_9FUNG|nr:hypothetical protein LPJ66_011205 [Kickxella alabastrina]